MNRALPGAKPVRRPSLDSLSSGVTARLVPTSLAMQRSQFSRIAHRLTSPGDCATADLLPSDCLPVKAPVSRRVARENLLNRRDYRTLTAKPLRGLPLSISALADKRQVVVAATRVSDGKALLLAESNLVALDTRTAGGGAAAIRRDARHRVAHRVGDAVAKLPLARTPALCRPLPRPPLRPSGPVIRRIVHDRSTFPFWQPSPPLRSSR